MLALTVIDVLLVVLVTDELILPDKYTNYLLRMLVLTIHTSSVTVVPKDVSVLKLIIMTIHEGLIPQDVQKYGICISCEGFCKRLKIYTSTSIRRYGFIPSARGLLH